MVSTGNICALSKVPASEHVHKQECSELHPVIVLPEYVLMVDEVGCEPETHCFQIHNAGVGNVADNAR